MRYLLFAVFIFFTSEVHAQQFRYDNVQFTTVFPEELCRLLKENPGALLLDVRSAGEFADTSTNKGLNLGHFKNAKNISVGEIGKRWHEIENYRSAPVFVYCSHSQRSRRASHLLADSGFTRIYNINGGMTQLLKLRNAMPGCFDALYTTNNKYKILTAGELVQRSKKNMPWYIIDLRSDSIYKGISIEEKRNAMGRLQPSVNILPGALAENLSKISRSKPILLVDEFGNQSAQAAEQLLNAGFTDVSVLLNGMDEWMSFHVNQKQLLSRFGWTGPKGYTLLSADEFNLQMAGRKATLIDVRPAPHFNNTSKNYWENIGHIKNAVNIPFEQIGMAGTLLPAAKNEYIVLYTFNDQAEVYEAARMLVNSGYKNVHILYGGIWNLRWTAHNVKDKSHLAQWVVDVPAENQ